MKTPKNTHHTIALARIRSLKRTLGALLALNVSITASAQTWTGGGADDFWSTGANWSTGTAPVAGASVTFGASSSLTPDLDSDRDVFNFSFTSSAPAYVFGSSNGSTLDFANVSRSSGSSVVTIDHDLRIRAASSQGRISASNSSGFIINGSIDTNGKTLKPEGNSVQTLLRRDHGHRGDFITTAFTGPEYFAANPFTGDVTIGRGTTTIGGSNGAFTGSTTVTVSSDYFGGRGAVSGSATGSSRPRPPWWIASTTPRPCV